MRCWVRLVTCVLTLGAAAALGPEVRAARSAQCRAMCLDEYNVGRRASHTKCLQNDRCFTCWEKCGSLHDVLQARPSSCETLPDCQDPGCQAACKFHVSPPEAPRSLALTSAQLEVRFGWSEVRWAVTGAEEVQHGNIVYLLLARRDGEWKELVQTPEASVVLINLLPGTALRLLAMTRLGQLTSLETVFDPSEPSQLVLDIQDNQLSTDFGGIDIQTYQIEIPGAWLLETVSVSRDETMVLAEVSWEPQAAGPAEYLVTWEVSGGGITGHLYTDITSVTLSLWPEAVYNIQVELMSPQSPDLEPLRSVPLVISTYSVLSNNRGVHKVPRSALASLRTSGDPLRPSSPAMIALYVLYVLVTLLACVFVVRRVVAHLRRTEAQRQRRQCLANSVFSVSRQLKPKCVVSHLDVAATIPSVHATASPV